MTDGSDLRETSVVQLIPRAVGIMRGRLLTSEYYTWFEKNWD